MASQGKGDRRALKTRQAIHEAFFCLLRERGFTRMSVTAICEHANINRGTFYLHYEDKYALLEALIDQALDEDPPFVSGEALSLCQRLPANDDYRLLYEDPELFVRVSERVLKRGAPQMVPQIMERTGLDEQDAYTLFLFMASGNLAVNRALGWKAGESYDHVQELLRAAAEGVFASLACS